MTLRLDPSTHDALRARAQAEGRSMQDVAKEAIEQYLSGRSQRIQAAIERVVTEDAELLDRLSG